FVPFIDVLLETEPGAKRIINNGDLLNSAILIRIGVSLILLTKIPIGGTSGCPVNLSGQVMIVCIGEILVNFCHQLSARPSPVRGSLDQPKRVIGVVGSIPHRFVNVNQLIDLASRWNSRFWQNGFLMTAN
ncbi:hypothetical protein LC612_39845, partial [Nostoc sp. CHAB 5834]|nr:hypothetical protein [Nostoc sp. CHAB 5834]